MENKVLILTAFTTNIIWNDYGPNDYIEHSNRINELYANRNGYDFLCVEYPEPLPELGPTWIKIDALIKALASGYDYVCWIDGDAIFTSTEPLDFLMGKDFAATKDLINDGHTLTAITTGLLLIKNTEFSRMVLDSLLEYVFIWKKGDYRYSWWHEQGMLNDMFFLPQLIQTYRFDKAYFNLINYLGEDLEEPVETENFKVFPNSLQSDDVNNMKFIFHAAGNTYTKGSRIKEAGELIEHKFLTNDIVRKMENKVIITFDRTPKVEILGDEELKYAIDFIDNDLDYVVHSDIISNNMHTSCFREWYTNWKIVISTIGTTDVETYYFGLIGQRVYLRFESAALGDSIAWIPYVEEFRKKHNCEVICATFWNHLFIKSYPDITFVEMTETPQDIYATYWIGWFNNPNRNPVDVRIIPLQKTASDILGLPFTEICPNLDYNLYMEGKS